jgi:hypothetical protein
MFEAGNLLYFKPFIFKNGAHPKNKFMVVLGQDANGNTLLASLPTSKDHVPGDIEVKGGCIDLPERQVNVFVFPAGENITMAQAGTNPFAFGVNTFVYGSDLDTYPVVTFHQQIAERIAEVELIGRLSENYFTALKECLKNSSMVKNKYKRIL